MPHLGVDAVDIDFGYARGLDMYRHVSDGSWSYEPDVVATLLCLLAPHAHCRFVNVGANIGYFALIAKKALGDRVDVHAYEPMPQLVERLDRAQTRNDVRFRVSAAALADFDGTAPFHLSARSDTSNSLNPDFRPSKEVINVEVTTLDAEFPPPRARRLLGRRPEPDTVLLIDTESTEPAVLRGGLEFISRVEPAIVCEVLAGRTEDDLADIIDRIGYRAHALTDDGPEPRDEVVGDRSYQHRDWLFLPADAAPPSPECFAATMGALRDAST